MDEPLINTFKSNILICYFGKLKSWRSARKSNAHNNYQFILTVFVLKNSFTISFERFVACSQAENNFKILLTKDRMIKTRVRAK